MTFRGHIENGVVVLDQDLVLPDGVTVEIRLFDHADDVASDRSPRLLARSVEQMQRGEGKDLRQAVRDVARTLDLRLERV